MIPIAKPYLDEKEIAAVKEAISSGWIAQGPKVKQFEEAFCSYTGAKYACAVSNCTTALHIALYAVGVRPGDVVITVSHSFIATANSVRHAGAEPVFVDIDLKTYNMSCTCLERVLNEECEMRDGQLYYRDVKRLLLNKSPLKYYAGTKRIGRIAAIMPVHQMGMPCDMDKIMSLTRAFNIPVVEDAACAVGSEIKIGKTRNGKK